MNFSHLKFSFCSRQVSTNITFFFHFFAQLTNVTQMTRLDLVRLKDDQRVQRTQEDVIDALYTYTSSNYKENLGKYGEIITLCSYITNVSIHFKTYLFNKLKDIESGLMDNQNKNSSGNGSTQQAQNCGLLMELLKGDLLFQPSYSINLN